MNIAYKINKACSVIIIKHLEKCANLFIPPLDKYVSIEEYGVKLFEKAINFEAWHEDKLVGLASAYFNYFTNKIGFLTNLSMLNEYRNKGIASLLISSVIDCGRKYGL